MTARWSGARVLLLGLARTSVALGTHLARQGARVTVVDDASGPAQRAAATAVEAIPARALLGNTSESLLDDADILFVTPGIARSHPLVAAAKQRGLPVSSEIELVFSECPLPITGVTGSAGKTTTTTLVERILAAASLPRLVGGNIGRPIVGQISSITPDARVILELSSFQLEHLRRSAAIGVILNVMPNHLDRHPTLDDYRAAKGRLIEFQSEDDLAILNADDPASQALARTGDGRRLWFSTERTLNRGAWLDRDALRIATDEAEGVLCCVGDLRVPGMHNAQNALAAALIALSVGAPIDAIRATLLAFEGIEHRIEFVREIDGVRWFNDSKATAPAETIAALRAFADPVIILAGGRSKRVALDDLAREMVARGRVIILFGEMRHEIAEALDGCSRPIHSVASLRDAVALANALAIPGDTVLLSPSGSSFDEFQNFEERGHFFKELVGALRSVAVPA
ncbi:MAG: UDP-N-acetylmuramoyl-L-alanine--D-glutamate ligase [Chloroflexota bacterium]|nr:MAG: UDP-N-acetylmuramoyl-L-alanine--D-glutamate ligase [Chloroflexota bacterium]